MSAVPAVLYILDVRRSRCPYGSLFFPPKSIRCPLCRRPPPSSECWLREQPFIRVVYNIHSKHHRCLERSTDTLDTDGDLNQRIGPHLDRLIDYLAGVRYSDPRIHKPPKLQPPIMVYIEIGILMPPGDGPRGRGRARIRYRGGQGRGRRDTLPSILNRS